MADGVSPPTLEELDLSAFEEAARVCPKGEAESRAAEDYVAWAQAHERVKVVEAEAPAAAVPTGYTFALFDARVDARGCRPPTDDAVYGSDPELWRNVSRGNCVCRVTTPSGETESFVAVRSMRKFTGGAGDDDDTAGEASSDAWRQFFLADPAACDTVVSMDKVNGEAAHLACRIVDGQAAVFVGSKNVHLVLCAAPATVAAAGADAEALLSAYEGQDRATYALGVGRCVLAALRQMGPARAEGLLRFLSARRVTANFEAVLRSNQHVVPYDVPGDAVGQLHFLCFTTNRYPAEDEDGPGAKATLCVDPSLGLRVAAALGLEPCDYRVLHASPASDGDGDGATAVTARHEVEVRGMEGTEGRVLYFVRDGQCVGLMKKKAVWYIVVRAIREKCRRMGNQFAKIAAGGKRRKGKGTPETEVTDPDALSELAHRAFVSARDRTWGRLREIQSWLDLSDAEVEEWGAKAEAYLGRVSRALATGEVTQKELEHAYVDVWRRLGEAPDAA